MQPHSATAPSAGAPRTNFLPTLYGLLRRGALGWWKADVHTVTSFASSAVPRDQLNRILADYVAIDRARLLRRALVTRFGILSMLAATAGQFASGPFGIARWLPAGVCLVPPTWAWIAELRLNRRLTRRLEQVEGAVTEKVVKSP